MSDTTKAKTREEKRQAREERRALRAVNILEMQDDQLGEIEDLADAQGLDSDGFVIVKTDDGVIACKKAHPAELDRFKKAINAPAPRRGKKKGPSAEESTQALVRSSLFFPEADVFEGIAAKYPLLWDTLGEGLVDLSGASFEAEVRKN